jgi:hypothetical protein
MGRGVNAITFSRPVAIFDIALATIVKGKARDTMAKLIQEAIGQLVGFVGWSCEGD